MDPSYIILNECLQILGQSEVTHIKKLRIEIQLIQLKRLLLKDDLPKDVISQKCGTNALSNLRSEMKNISSTKGGGDGVHNVMESLNSIIAAISVPAGANC